MTVSVDAKDTSAHDSRRNSPLISWIRVAHQRGYVKDLMVGRLIRFAVYYRNPPNEELRAILRAQIGKDKVVTVGDMAQVFCCPAVKAAGRNWAKLYFLLQARGTSTGTLMEMRKAFVKDTLLPK